MKILVVKEEIKKLNRFLSGEITRDLEGISKNQKNDEAGRLSNLVFMNYKDLDKVEILLSEVPSLSHLDKEKIVFSIAEGFKKIDFPNFMLEDYLDFSILCISGAKKNGLEEEYFKKKDYLNDLLQNKDNIIDKECIRLEGLSETRTTYQSNIREYKSLSAQENLAIALKDKNYHVRVKAIQDSQKAQAMSAVQLQAALTDENVSVRKAAAFFYKNQLGKEQIEAGLKDPDMSLRSFFAQIKFEWEVEKLKEVISINHQVNKRFLS